MALQSDLLIIGGGPAGLAAAIVARIEGASVRILMREEHLRERPGETLHPGIEPLLDRLGVGDAIRAGSYTRFPGIRLATLVGEQLMAYGETNDEPWLGFQIPGRLLDTVLKRRAEYLGTRIHMGEEARNVEWDVNGRFYVGNYTARYVLDCTGGRHWLARRLGIKINRLSSPLVAHYGYVEMDAKGEDEWPLFEVDETGWLWTARISDTLMHWTRLNLIGGAPKRGWLPEQWVGLSCASRPRRVNVTWRRCERVAGPGYFICGEAASVLDPASSHGVLTAVMSGMLAGQYAVRVIRDPRLAEEARSSYEAWIYGRIKADSKELAKLYTAFPNPPGWVVAYASDK